MKHSTIGHAAQGVPSGRPSLSLVRGGAGAESSRAIMEIATEIMSDTEVTGVMLIILRRDGSENELEVMNTGVMRQARDAAYALAKVSSAIL